MNSWPGPENSWEGVDAYFTWANNAGLLTTFVVIVNVKMITHHFQAS